ncbi:MAG: choice-of-anchor P family protein [Candidatus Krumholzibacteriia bacterium]
MKRSAICPLWVRVAVIVLPILCTGFDAAFAALAVRARAFAFYLNVPSQGVVDEYHGDTGWLPPLGGSQSSTLVNHNIGTVLSTDSASVSSDGDECEGESSVSIGPTALLAGAPGELTFSSLSSDDDDTCCVFVDHPKAAVISDLVFGGSAVTVSGAFNQTVVRPGVGTLIVNELVVLSPDDCDDDDFLVNALHLTLDSGEEIVIGCTIFHSDDQCCPIPVEPSSWGRIKAIYE